MIQDWPLTELGLISVFPLHVSKSYWRKWLPPLLLHFGFKWIMQVKHVASTMQGTVFSKNIFVNMWHLFLKLILRRPILAMWQRSMIDVYWVSFHSTQFPDSLAAMLGSCNLFWPIGSEWECHLTALPWKIKSRCELSVFFLSLTTTLQSNLGYRDSYRK